MSNSTQQDLLRLLELARQAREKKVEEKPQEPQPIKLGSAFTK